MNSRQVAEMGVARTFQSLALFKGMSVLDNIMSGRNLKMKTNLFQQAVRGFGWGAAAGDMDLDGRLDIVQANGMVDNAYDRLYPGCPDYWYWNDKIALTRPDVHGFADRWADLRGRCIFGAEANRVYLNQGRHFVDVASQVGLALAIRSFRPSLPVLFMSGFVEHAEVRDVIAAAGERLLQKPFTPVELATKVREALDSAATLPRD